MCPGCAGAKLEAVTDGELTNFFCRDCMACWHVELDYIHRVLVTSCPGCAHSDVCRLEVGSERMEEG